MSEAIAFTLHNWVESNGKTIRENNLQRQHAIPVGTLVEASSGARLFVARHCRDCDGTPLYGLAVSPDATEYSNVHYGYMERGLRVVRRARAKGDS